MLQEAEQEVGLDFHQLVRGDPVLRNATRANGMAGDRLPTRGSAAQPTPPPPPPPPPFAPPAGANGVHPAAFASPPALPARAAWSTVHAPTAAARTSARGHASAPRGEDGSEDELDRRLRQLVLEMEDKRAAALADENDVRVSVCCAALAHSHAPRLLCQRLRNELGEARQRIQQLRAQLGTRSSTPSAAAARRPVPSPRHPDAGNLGGQTGGSGGGVGVGAGMDAAQLREELTKQRAKLVSKAARLRADNECVAHRPGARAPSLTHRRSRTAARPLSALQAPVRRAEAAARGGTAAAAQAQVRLRSQGICAGGAAHARHALRGLIAQRSLPHAAERDGRAEAATGRGAAAVAGRTGGSGGARGGGGR